MTAPAALDLTDLYRRCAALTHADAVVASTLGLLHPAATRDNAVPHFVWNNELTQLHQFIGGVLTAVAAALLARAPLPDSAYALDAALVPTPLLEEQAAVWRAARVDGASPGEAHRRAIGVGRYGRRWETRHAMTILLHRLNTLDSADTQQLLGCAPGPVRIPTAASDEARTYSQLHGGPLALDPTWVQQQWNLSESGYGMELPPLSAHRPELRLWLTLRLDGLSSADAWTVAHTVVSG